jgi:hypothetical protein
VPVKPPAKAAVKPPAKRKAAPTIPPRTTTESPKPRGPKR